MVILPLMYLRFLENLLFQRLARYHSISSRYFDATRSNGEDRQRWRASIFDADRIYGAAADPMAVRIWASNANDTTLVMDELLAVR
jgi:hypothetical protein